jgi:hypothetical protein
MKIIQKMRIFNYAVLIFLSLGLTASGKQTDKPEQVVKSNQPRPRKVKNGATYAEDVNSGKIKKDDFIGSPTRKVSASFGDCTITIRYSSPGVRGRTIWGKLVPYGKLWVTGANHATSIAFDRDVRINNRKIPAGTYAFFTIPREKYWVIILNKNTEQHLTDDYSKTDDVLRFTTLPAESPSIVQRLTYNILPKNDHSAVISMTWEKRVISFVLEKYRAN